MNSWLVSRGLIQGEIIGKTPPKAHQLSLEFGGWSGVQAQGQPLVKGLKVKNLKYLYSVDTSRRPIVLK